MRLPAGWTFRTGRFGQAHPGHPHAPRHRIQPSRRKLPARLRAAGAGPEEPLVAKGRVACDGDWAGITDVWVAPEHRRRGLGVVVLDAMISWAAERGATSAYLQVRADNTPALALYATMGFRTNHTYRYLAAPSADDGG